MRAESEGEASFGWVAVLESVAAQICPDSGLWGLGMFIHGGGGDGGGGAGAEEGGDQSREGLRGHTGTAARFP